MCRTRTHAMPAVGVCLLAGIVSGCAARWTPPTPPQPLETPADTTALGVHAELPLLSMWPGEARRIVLPVVVTTPKSPRAFALRGEPGLSFRPDVPKSRFAPSILGGLASAAEQGACIVRVDSLAIPGDTLTLVYTVSTVTQPPRFSRWKARIVVETPLLVLDGFATTNERLSVGPNPLNPSTTLRFDVPTAGHVILEVYDVRGSRVATLLDANLDAGSHTTTWNGRDERGVSVGSGVYFGRLTSSTGVRSYKMTVVK